jgi:hypothetical protein
MNVIDKITYYQKVWKVALPHLPTPEPQDIRFWTDLDVNSVESAILQASNRFAESRIKRPFDASEAYRYITATAKGMARRAKEEKIRRIKEADRLQVPMSLPGEASHAVTVPTESNDDVDSDARWNR